MYKVLLVCLMLPNLLYGQTDVTVMTTKSNDGYSVSYEVSSKITRIYSLGGSVINQVDAREINIFNNILLYSSSFDLCSDIEFGVSKEDNNHHAFVAAIGVGGNKSVGQCSYMVEPRLIYDEIIKWDVVFGFYYGILAIELNTDMNNYEFMIGVVVNLD